MNVKSDVYKTSLTPPCFIEVSVSNQESEWLCICVLGVSSLPIYTIFLLNFGNVPTVWYGFLFHLITKP